jgi:hypothetical protein
MAAGLLLPQVSVSMNDGRARPAWRVTMMWYPPGPGSALSPTEPSGARKGGMFAMEIGRAHV